MWDLSSLIRNWTRILWIARMILGKPRLLEYILSGTNFISPDPSTVFVHTSQSRTCALWLQQLPLSAHVHEELELICLCAATAKSLQSCPTLCDPRDGSPPGSPIPGILQARTLEWVAISFSNAWKWKVKVKSLSGVRLLATPWTAAHQAPPSMGYSRQEHWSGVPSPSPCLCAC